MDMARVESRIVPGPTGGRIQRPMPWRILARAFFFAANLKNRLTVRVISTDDILQKNCMSPNLT